MQNSTVFLSLKRTSTPAEHGPPELNRFLGHLMITEDVAITHIDQEVEVVVLPQEGDNIPLDEWPVRITIPAESLTDESLFEERIWFQAA